MYSIHIMLLLIGFNPIPQPLCPPLSPGIQRRYVHLTREKSRVSRRAGHPNCTAELFVPMI